VPTLNVMIIPRLIQVYPGMFICQNQYLRWTYIAHLEIDHTTRRHNTSRKCAQTHHTAYSYIRLGLSVAGT
jgi:hypothetical protein